MANKFGDFRFLSYLCRREPTNTYNMQLKFEGQANSIDANTLVNILIHYQSVVNEANRIYGGGARDIHLQVNAIEKGSFIVDISVIQDVLHQLFSKDTVSYTSGLVGIVTGVYSLYKHFKGKPIKTEEDKEKASSTINITVNGSVSIDNITNVYNQRIVREAISKSFETADSDSNVEGFTVLKEKDSTESVSFDRKDFKEYIYDNFDDEKDMPDERVIDEITTLTIVGLNFEKGSRWQFMYNGFKIGMIVKDDALMQKINEGARFGKGDAIRVKLRRIQQYNREYKAYENKSYKIVEFLEHIICKEGDLFTENIDS